MRNTFKQLNSEVDKWLHLETKIRAIIRATPYKKNPPQVYQYRTEYLKQVIQKHRTAQNNYNLFIQNLKTPQPCM